MRVARVTGIPITISWSWLVIFMLIVWTLAAGVFPDSAPHRPAATYAVMGVLAALVLFVSLILHELGHALQARREGVQIEGIRLWLFGGIAEMRSGFPSPGAEFRREWPATRVQDLLIPYSDVPQLTRETPATEALDMLMASTVKRGFVVLDGQVVGFVSISDLAKLIADSPPAGAVPLTR